MLHTLSTYFQLIVTLTLFILGGPKVSAGFPFSGYT